MTLQAFIDKVGPVVSAAWLNFIDRQGNRYLYGVDTGVANAYIVSPLSTQDSFTLSAGALVSFFPINANTGAATINVAGTGLKAILNRTGGALTGGEISTTGPCWIQYNGTAFQIVGTGILPQYVRTAAEITAGVTPTDYNVPSHLYGNVIHPHRYGWSTSASGTVNYTALVNANLVAAAIGNNGNQINIGAGVYDYAPSAELILNSPLIGYGPSISSINCLTASYTGRFFRITGISVEMSYLTIRTPGNTGLGTGVFLSDPVISSNTGHIRMTRVWMFGFNRNLELGNLFMVTLDQIRSENAVEGEWCVPDGSTINGFITTVLHLNCNYNANSRNIHYASPVNSFDISFVGGTIENATGIINGSDFQNIFTLRFASLYTEGNSGIPWCRCTSISNLVIDGLVNVNGGQLRIDDTSTYASIRGVLTVGTTGVLNSVGTTNRLTIESSTFPASGNTWATSSYVFTQTLIDGVYYRFLQEQGSITFTLTGCTTSPTLACNYTVMGDDVSVVIGVLTGTSNTNACTLTGIPVGLRPATAQFIPMSIWMDNGGAVTGVAQVTTAGAIVLYVNANANGFTAAGTKGIGFALRLGWKKTA